MTDGYEQEQAGAGAESGSDLPNLQGSISMTATGGFHTANQVGQSPATVEWTQGSAPIASAQFSLAHMPRIPMPPPPQITDLTPGENSIPFFGSWSSASVTWTYSGDSGAGTFAWGMAGLPVGASGSTYVTEVVGPQKANFDIAFADAPTSCLFSIRITPSQGFMGSETVGIYVDGNYFGSLADGSVVVITGKVLTLQVDFRSETIPDYQVGYTLQYQW